MGWPLRMFQPLEIYFVSVRCFQRRLLMRPSSEMEEVLGGVLARAARLNQVDLFAFVFASNHLHLLVRAPAGNLPRFMQHLLTNASKKVAALVGWEGRFWQRRYSAEPVLDEAALLGRVRYILAHGVKEGLVRLCRQWPGLNSLSMMWTREPRTFRWFNWTRRAKAGTSTTDPRFAQRWAEEETLELAPLPIEALRGLGAMRRFLRRAMQAIEEQAAREFPQVLGLGGVLAQNPLRRARRRERTTRPLCHTTIPRLLREYREKYWAFVAAFRDAASRWKRLQFGARFPERAFRPFVWPEPLRTQIAA